MNSRSTKRVIGELSPPPSQYSEDTLLTFPGGDAELRCNVERDGALVACGLRFLKVRALRFRAEGHSTLWHSEGAYYTVVEVMQSDWVAELLEAEPSVTSGFWRIRHFLIYIADDGAYEFAAEDVNWLPEEPVS